MFIGDQAARAFWDRFRSEVPALDVVIDDGGHETHQQIATLEALLPHLRPGGVFICEDVHGITNGFARYAMGLAQNLHAFEVGDDQSNSSGGSSPAPRLPVGRSFRPRVPIRRRDRA